MNFTACSFRPAAYPLALKTIGDVVSAAEAEENAFNEPALLLDSPDFRPLPCRQDKAEQLALTSPRCFCGHIFYQPADSVFAAVAFEKLWWEGHGTLLDVDLCLHLTPGLVWRKGESLPAGQLLNDSQCGFTVAQRTVSIGKLHIEVSGRIRKVVPAK